TALVDDNTFTNLIAAHNLRCAARAAQRFADTAHELGVTDDEIAEWDRCAERTYIPYDEELGLPEQSEGFTRLPEWDFAATTDKYPLLLHEPYFEIYRHQVIKQADLELALFWFGDR